jgi:YbbR domain-containing protein
MADPTSRYDSRGPSTGQSLWLALTQLARIVTRNFFWKALALAISAVIWLSVASEPELATIVTVPVEYRNYPEGLEISSATVGTVNVEARGPAGRLSSLHDPRIAAVVDFSTVSGPGERTFTLTASEFNLPRGVELIRTVPSQLHFRFERSLNRMLPVEVPLSGRLPNGVKIGGVDVEPPTLKVGGPESHVMNAKKLMADPFDITQVDGDLQRTVTVYSADPEVRLLSRPQVTVRIHVLPASRSR